MKFVGLDLSLTGTGVAVVDRLDDKFDLARWNSAPGEHARRKDQPDWLVRFDIIKTSPGDFPNHFARIDHIINELTRFLELDHERNDKQDEPDLWIIEDYFVGQNKKTTLSLAELGATIRYWLFSTRRSFINVIPSQLKKFIIGKGQGDKGLVMVRLFKFWGLETEENNTADALVLANMGVALYEMMCNHRHDLFKVPQQQVLKKLTERPFPYLLPDSPLAQCL